jgi:hypothetical protein
MAYIITSNESVFPYNSSDLLKDWDMTDEKATHITWVKCTDNENEIQGIQDAIESCCLLKSLVVFDTSTDIVEWLTSTFDKSMWTFHQVIIEELPVSLNLQTLDVQPLTRDKSIPLAISSQCWGYTNTVPHDIKHVNIAHASQMTIHDIRAFKRNKYSQVLSLNGLFFNRNENVFQKDKHLFIEQFTKMIHFAKELGAKSVIYGSASSKFIHIARSLEFQAFAKGNDTFISSMIHIGKIAAQNGITIYIKPNQNEPTVCNFMSTDLEVADMIINIGLPNVKQAAMRNGLIMRYGNDFELLEGAMSAQTLERLITCELLV